MRGHIETIKLTPLPPSAVLHLLHNVNCRYRFEHRSDEAMGGGLAFQTKLVSDNVISSRSLILGHCLMEQRPAGIKTEGFVTD